MAKAKVTPKKKSKFQERLEEMQKKSIEMQKKIINENNHEIFYRYGESG